MEQETPVKLIISPSYSYNGSICNKGSSIFENKAALYVNHCSQPYQFVGRPEETEEDGEIVVWPISVYNTS